MRSLSAILKAVPLISPWTQWVAFVFFLWLPLSAFADTACSTNDSTSLLSQAKDLCQLQCGLDAQRDGRGSLQSQANCRTTEQILNATLLQQTAQFWVGCAEGLGDAAVDVAAAVLNLQEARDFESKCQANPKCRISLARKLDAYRAHKENASGSPLLDIRTHEPIYQMSDSEVAQAIAGRDWRDLERTSARNESASVHSCQSRLGEITRSLGDKLAEAESKSDDEAKLSLLQMRFTQLQNFDPGCPGLLKLKNPQGLKTAPDLRKAAVASLSSARQTGTQLTNAVNKFLSDRSVALQCYDPETAAKIQCYAATYVGLEVAGAPAGAAVLSKLKVLLKLDALPAAVLAESGTLKRAEAAGAFSAASTRSADALGGTAGVAPGTSAAVTESAAPTVGARSPQAGAVQPAAPGPRAKTASAPAETTSAFLPAKSESYDRASTMKSSMSSPVVLKYQTSRASIYRNYDRLKALRKERASALAAGRSTTSVDRELAVLKPETGRLKLEYPAQRTAIERGEVIVTNPYNEKSLPYVEGSADTKPMSEKDKTDRHAGLLLDQSAGQPKLTPEGNVITADLDIKVVLRRTQAGRVEISPEHGYESSADRLTRETINAHFKEIDDQRSINRDIVRHGPEHAHPELAIQSNKYPLKAYWPDGEIEMINDDTAYDNFVHRAQRKGYFGQSAP